jgi:DNA polymerase III epsilon subunit-like protein
MDTEFDRLVVIDFETTGTSRNKRAVEIAWFELNKNFEIIDEQNSLINPMIPIPAEVIAIHKITDDMVKNSPTLDEFIVDINQDTFSNSSVCVVAHNISFDLPLFEKYCGNVVELCTLKLARKLYPELENHKLSTISRQFGFIHEEAHRARSDAMQVVHFLALIKETHGLSISEMIDMTRPTSVRPMNGVTVKPNTVSSNREIHEELVASLHQDAESDVMDSVEDIAIYDFTDWEMHPLAILCSQLYYQGIETSWSGNFLTVHEIFEDSVDAIVAEVLESWSEKKLEEKRGNSRETVQYVCRDWQISELTDLVNELNEHAIEHEWVGHHLRVFIEDELTVDEIIGELSLNPNFALNSFEEFKNDDSGKYSDKTSWRKHFTFPFFTIPQFVNLENELAEEDITHFWKDQILHITEGDIGVVKTIIEEDFGIIEEPS